MPASQEHISQMYLKIGGSTASAEIMHKVREIIVDSSMYLPDMFSVQLDDSDLSLMDSATLEIGKAIEISGKSAEANSSAKMLIQGEIVAIEPEFDQDIGTTITIRGYDKSHRLHRGKKNQVYKQEKDSDIIRKIVQGCGLTANVDATSVTYEHVFQENQTDMEFIQDRAKRNGFQAYFEDGGLCFKKASSTSSSGVALEWGKDLSRFQARFSGAGQVAKAEVHGWDIKQKQAVVGTKSTPEGTPTVNSKQHGGSLADSAFGSRPGLTESLPVENQNEAEILAQSELNENCQKFFQAEGICLGNPAIRAGKQVELKKIGARFSGKYTISRAIHRFNLAGYVTEFEISGHRTNTLTQLLSDKENRDTHGVVIGLVTNTQDPDGLARVKVKFPTIDDKLESDWARLATPMAGSGRGIEFIPEVDDEVLVAFEHNDFNSPYVIGSLWNGKDKPPEDNKNIIANGKVNKRIIKSRSGHIITLDDTQNGENISIVDKAGQKIVIESASGKEKIEVTDKKGSKITMDGATQSVSIESAMDLTIKAKGKIQIEGKTGINVKSDTNLQMEGSAGVDIKTNAAMNIKGTTTSVQGQATAEIKSSGILTVQGSLVKIN